MIKWTATNKEIATIIAIAKRATAMQPKYDYTTCMMDVEATHCNGTPLKLQDLLETDNFNFAHDVFGIARHIDRGTGKLKNCFSPRFGK